MGWRADQGYEDAQRDGFRNWKATLTWRDYLEWQARRHGPFVAVAGSAAVILWLFLG